MSLPSRARYFDSAGNAIGEEHINCGWFDTPEAIYLTLIRLEEIPEGAGLVKLYDILVPIDVVTAIKRPDFADKETVLWIISDLQKEAQEIWGKEKLDNPEPGYTFVVNGSGDLAMDGEAKHFIGKRVEFIRIQKSGLYEVAIWPKKDKTIALPKRNLTAK